MNQEIHTRLRWIKHYQLSGNLGVTCQRCGISRPTLRKWLQRYEESGLNGLANKSRKPKVYPNRKIFDEHEQQVLLLRRENNLGARRIQNELKRQHQLSLSLATIHKILVKNKAKPLRHPKREKKVLRYSRLIPGERVQVDTCKIAPCIYQYTAIDDCTRYQVMEIYPTRTAANTILFFEKMIEEMRFPVQSIQSDRGKEFFAYKVQEWLKEYCIKFRPIRPRQPHLNGKVERVQQTDLKEFWALIDFSEDHLSDQLAYYQHYYNWDRIHGSLGKTPMDKVVELSRQTPFWDEVEDGYDSTKEFIRVHDYKRDVRLLKLKRSL
jgi:transposase InsO family protein